MPRATRPRDADAIDDERGADRDEHQRQRAGEVQREPAAADRDRHAGKARDQRPDQFAGALRGEVEREPEAEAAIARPDRAQVRAARLDHLRIVAEQAQPCARAKRRRHTDDLAQHEGKRGAGPGDAQRALALARADIRADHSDQRPADAEHQRHEQVFEPRRGAEARDRSGPRRETDQRGRCRDRDVGLYRAHTSHRADAQDLARHRPAQRREPRSARCCGPRARTSRAPARRTRL